ncbi:hypothetical protein ACFE04_020678 [Oxalis oulophora]
MWNRPVHKWMVDHVYFPCLRLGIPKWSSVLIVFFVSAIFHESPLKSTQNEFEPAAILSLQVFWDQNWKKDSPELVCVSKSQAEQSSVEEELIELVMVMFIGWLLVLFTTSLKITSVYQF